MEESKHKTSFIDYPTLIDLARSRNIKFVEARGLDTRKGIRFGRNGSQWIAVDADLPLKEKVRTLGYLLENEPAKVAARIGMKVGFSGTSSMSPVLTLCC
jgi:hypothetical protein